MKLRLKTDNYVSNVLNIEFVNDEETINIVGQYEGLNYSNNYLKTKNNEYVIVNDDGNLETTDEKQEAFFIKICNSLLINQIKEKNIIETSIVEANFYECLDINNNMSALMLATIDGNLFLVKSLLEKGYHKFLNLRNYHGHTVLFFADKQHDILKELLKYKPNLEIEDNDGNTLLMVSDDLGTCKLLIEAGADVNHIDDFETTAILLAIKEKNINKIALLLEYGADPNANEIFYELIHNYDAEIANMIFNSPNFNINRQNDLGYSLPMMAYYYEDKSLYNDILKYNPDLSLQNYKGETLNDLITSNA